MARALAEGHSARPGLRSRLADAVAGPRAIRRLTLTHAVDNFADSLITLSLIGSLFFSVSLEASRTRILLYLLLTAAPLAIVAQVVGPALDRIRAGSRFVLISSHLARASLRLAAGQLAACRSRSIRWCSASCCRARHTRWPRRHWSPSSRPSAPSSLPPAVISPARARSPAGSAPQSVGS